MKFNEKLIELRKKEGLSQEELGYKLNVTRQTVSKWELGQTTPEMDKLVEISKIFNISVDELVKEQEITSNENPIIEDKPIIEKKNNKIVVIIIIVLIVILIFIIAPLMLFNKVAGNINQTQQNIFDSIFSMFNNVTDEETGENKNEYEEILNKLIEGQEKITEDAFNTTEDFNKSLEMLSGRQMGIITSEVLDKIITTNQKDDRKITVKYLDKETHNVDEIKDIKQKIEIYDDYEIGFEYDEEGFINKAIIEKYEEISETDISIFNSALEIYNGTNMGGVITTVLDKIITSNKKEDRKITVKYMEQETQNEEKIKNIKKEIQTFENYEVSFDYDADGFINRATIEKL